MRRSKWVDVGQALNLGMSIKTYWISSTHDIERAIEQEKDEAKRKKLSAKHVKLSRELRTAKRIEFTVQSEKGQDKGHAIVAEELFDDDGNEMDFILIEDTKREVALVNGRKWVGINFVHGHDHIRLDIQSLIHLQEFLAL